MEEKSGELEEDILPVIHDDISLMQFVIPGLTKPAPYLIGGIKWLSGFQLSRCIVLGKMGYPGAEVVHYLRVTTSSVNRLAISEEAADLKKCLKML